jgi:prevent-host-death family protein
MRAMSIREVRDNLVNIEQVIEREGEVTVTRHGRPVAKIVALRQRSPVPSHADLRASMPRMERPSEELVREDRDRA